MSGNWHGALEAVAAISQQSMPTTQQPANLEAAPDAQLRCILNALLAVSKTSAVTLTEELGIAVGQWVVHITRADGRVHELMAPVLGLQTMRVDVNQNTTDCRPTACVNCLSACTHHSMTHALHCCRICTAM